MVEMTEILSELRRRFEILEVPVPWGAVVDNCCAVRKSINNALETTNVYLDIYHCIARSVPI